MSELEARFGRAGDQELILELVNFDILTAYRQDGDILVDALKVPWTL
jgi:hypothetical protein